MKNDENHGIGLFVWGGLLAVILGIAIFVALGGLNLIIGREFAKFGEETRRQVQEESRSYQEGMAQNLDKLCLEWERTGNDAIAQSIRHRVAGYKGELPDHLETCVAKARK